MAFTHALATNRYGESDLIVSSDASQGTHTTLAGAMADAVSGQTIFLRTSVTENVTLTAGVNITAWTGGSLNTPSIIGTLTMTTAGTCNISGIKLQTNSAAILAVTGSAASIVNLNDCYLNCSNNTGITYSSSNSASGININNCQGNLGTTGIGLFTDTSTGPMVFTNCKISNTGASTTASSTSTAAVQINNCGMAIPFSTSSTGSIAIANSIVDTSATNTTCVTTAGTGSSNIVSFYLASGSASSVSIGSGTTVVITSGTVVSSNTNAITGAGTINYNGISFSSTSSTINTTTQSMSGTLSGSKNTAPTAGMLGEQIRSFIPFSSQITLSSSIAQNITSISLTAGVWDVSCLAFFIYTGLSTYTLLGISTTTGTLPGNGAIGDNEAEWQFPSGSVSALSLSIPSYRMVLSATTTVYLVAFGTFTTGAGNAYGRISATRAG